jgi:transposase
MHRAVDALGHPRRCLFTAGHGHDSPQAAALIAGFAAQVLMADKGYDAATLIEAVTARGIHVVIPPRSTRIQPREYDRHLSQARHLVECFINKFTHDRRVFSRVEKLVKNYWGFLSVVSALI